MSIQRTVSPFVIQLDARRNFRDWMKKEFPYFNGNMDEKERGYVIQHKEQIFQVAKQVLEITYERSSKPIADYYKQDLPDIHSAHQNGDNDAFIYALLGFLAGIAWE